MRSQGLKPIFKRVWNRVNGVHGIILILYFIFITITAVIISKGLGDIFFCIRWIFIGVLLSVIICPIILHFTEKITISTDEDKNHNYIRWYLTVTITSLSIFLFFYLSYYPGVFLYDPMDQFNQALSNNYSDWHPVIDTLLVMKIPLLLSGGWQGSIVLFQIIEFSLVISYAVVSILRYTNKRYAILSYLFMLCNPYTFNYVVTPWKDTTFAMSTLLLTTYVFNIVASKGYWIKKHRNVVLVVLLFAITSLLRHNAPLFTIPLFITVLLSVSYKKGLLILLSIALLIVAIKFPLYSVLNVEKPQSRQIETLGLPMSIIGAVVKYDPSSLDAETEEFAYKVAPKEVWDSEYNFGDFNSVKWNEKTNTSVIEEYGRGRIIKMMLSCFKSSPKVSIYALIKLTDPVYSITDDIKNKQFMAYSQNDSAISRVVHRINMLYSNACIMIFPHLFVYVGSMMLVLVISILAKCKFKNKEYWKKLFLVIPVFTYNFGSSLFMSGSMDAGRFFYYTFLLVPVLLVPLFRKQYEAKGDSK